MAAVSYTIRVLPWHWSVNPSRTVYSVLFVLCTLRDAGRHDLPGHHPCYPDPHFRTGGTHCRYHRRMARCRTVSGIRDLLCAGVCDRIVCIMPCNKTRHWEGFLPHGVFLWSGFFTEAFTNHIFLTFPVRIPGFFVMVSNIFRSSTVSTLNNCIHSSHPLPRSNALFNSNNTSTIPCFWYLKQMFLRNSPRNYCALFVTFLSLMDDNML